jgi:hypothetical protein
MRIKQNVFLLFIYFFYILILYLKLGNNLETFCLEIKRLKKHFWKMDYFYLIGCFWSFSIGQNVQVLFSINVLSVLKSNLNIHVVYPIFLGILDLKICLWKKVISNISKINITHHNIYIITELFRDCQFCLKWYVLTIYVFFHETVLQFSSVWFKFTSAQTPN